MGINIDVGWQTEESSHTGARSTAGPHSEAAAGDGMKNDATVAADTGDPPDKQILFELLTELREIAFADKCPNFTSNLRLLTLI